MCKPQAWAPSSVPTDGACRGTQPQRPICVRGTFKSTPDMPVRGQGRVARWFITVRTVITLQRAGVTLLRQKSTTCSLNHHVLNVLR